MRKNIVSICVLALLLVTFSVFGQEDRNKGIINSALIGLESVSYTHLTLPTT